MRLSAVRARLLVLIAHNVVSTPDMDGRQRDYFAAIREAVPLSELDHLGPMLDVEAPEPIRARFIFFSCVLNSSRCCDNCFDSLIFSYCH